MAKSFFKLPKRLCKDLGKTTEEILKSIRQKDIIGIQEARYLAIELGRSLTIPTAISMVDKHKLGHQPHGNGGSWVINRQWFEDFLLKGISRKDKGDSNG